MINLDNNKLTLMVLLDLSAAFDTVNLQTLIEIFKNRFNITGTALKLIQSYLTGRSQTVFINNTHSYRLPSEQGMPQGSCFGPFAFLIYISELYDTTSHHQISIEGYADDHQIYITFNPQSDSHEQAIRSMESCINSVRKYMLNNQLKINDDKTEIIVIGNKNQLDKIRNRHIRVDTASVTPSNSVRNLGFQFDKTMSFNEHINNICKKANYQLIRISQLRKYLSLSSTQILIHSFVTSQLDYCNAIMYKLPKYQIKKLQVIQNKAARIITKTRKYDHITPVLKSLHWLPVDQRITYKIALLVYKSLNDLSPPYLKNILQKYAPSRNLRPANLNKLTVPKTKKAIRERGFH